MNQQATTTTPAPFRPGRVVLALKDTISGLRFDEKLIDETPYDGVDVPDLDAAEMMHYLVSEYVRRWIGPYAEMIDECLYPPDPEDRPDDYEFVQVTDEDAEKFVRTVIVEMRRELVTSYRQPLSPHTSCAWESVKELAAREAQRLLLVTMENFAQQHIDVKAT